MGGRCQFYTNGKEKVDQDRYQGSCKGSQKIEQDDCFHIAFLPFLLLRQGICHQSEDQERSDGLEAANEDLTQKSDGLCLGEDDSQQDTNANPDGNPLD